LLRSVSNAVSIGTGNPSSDLVRRHATGGSSDAFGGAGRGHAQEPV